MHFILPSMTIGKVLGELYQNSEITEFYINDTQITSPWQLNTPTDYDVNYLSPSLFTADGSYVNVVAFRARMGTKVNNPGFAFKLTFAAYTEEVSLFQDAATSKYIWGSSGEGSYQGSNTGDPAGWSDAIAGGSPLVPGGAACARDNESFVGIFASPWPVYGSESGKKLGNCVGIRDTPTIYATYYFKQAVDIPAGAGTDWYLYIRKVYSTDQIINDIYINGTRLSTGTPASAQGETPTAPTSEYEVSKRVYRFSVPSSAITMNDRNTIAIKLTRPSTISSNIGSNIAWYLVQQ
jgi:hypothetical protein